VNNKGLLLGDFGTVDQILSALEYGENVEDLKTGYDAPMVDRLFELWQLSAHMRESPYTLGS
jgi:hypothetical protein